MNKNDTKQLRFRHSLNKKVVQATIFGSVLLGAVMLAVGLGLYTYSLADRYISQSCELALSTTTIIYNMEYDVEGMTKEVMDIYRNLSEDERQAAGTDAYRAKFESTENIPGYWELFNILTELKAPSSANDLYIATFDEQTQAIVYVCDPDRTDETGCWPGDWESVSEKELNKFVHPDADNYRIYDISKTDRYGWMCTSGYPIYNQDGKIVSYVLADVTLQDLIRSVRLLVLQYVVAFAVVVLILSRILTRRMRKMVVDPVNRIAKAAEAYAKDRSDGVALSGHFADLDIHTDDEVENLGLVMADMERSMEEYEENLTRITAEKERIETELSLAARIQADMLPGTFPPFPDRSEFDLYASMDPAKEVGGDFYDFYLIDEDHLALVIADVSGKGIPAALFMMAAQIIIKNNAMQGKMPSEILKSTNRAICANNREEMFVTVWIGILEISTGKLTAANAGHEYPALKRKEGCYELFKDRHGLVVGAMEGIRYKDYELTLAPGDTLFVYTDGVPEATNEQNELFGTERMIEALNTGCSAGPKETLAAVRREVDHFVGEAEQFDDLTMLCLEYFGNNDPQFGR